LKSDLSKLAKSKEESLKRLKEIEGGEKQFTAELKNTMVDVSGKLKKYIKSSDISNQLSNPERMSEQKQ